MSNSHSILVTLTSALSTRKHSHNMSRCSAPHGQVRIDQQSVRYKPEYCSFTIRRVLQKSMLVGKQKPAGKEGMLSSEVSRNRCILIFTFCLLPLAVLLYRLLVLPCCGRFYNTVSAVFLVSLHATPSNSKNCH